LNFISQTLLDFRTEYLTSADHVLIKDHQSTDFIISLSAKELGKEERIQSEHIKRCAGDLLSFVSPRFKKSKFSSMLLDTDIIIGHSRLVNNPVIKLERQIYHAIKYAKNSSSMLVPEYTIERRRHLSNIINNKLLNTSYQPIINLSSDNIIGYEALNRPLAGTGFDLTESMFLWANNLMLDLQLDILCIEQAFDNARGLFSDNLLLFINTFPKTIENSTLILHQLSRKLKEYNVSPEHIILEMTERTAIEDISIFKSTISEYKREGFKIAIDDVGAGYSSLSTIAHLEPDFLKFDKTLVRNIHREPIKQQLLKTVIEMAERIKAKVIAEGIEQQEEFNVLVNNDIEYGQGFYFGRIISPPE